jgi:hypothetical protein
MKKLSFYLMSLCMAISCMALFSACDSDDDNGSNGGDYSNYKTLLVGTWTITQDDPSWKSIATFNANGTFRSVDYYDIDADQTFSEESGTYTGEWSLEGNVVTITTNSTDDESVISGEYRIVKLTETSMQLEDSDGYSMYGSK